MRDKVLSSPLFNNKDFALVFLKNEINLGKFFKRLSYKNENTE